MNFMTIIIKNNSILVFWDLLSKKYSDITVFQSFVFWDISCWIAVDVHKIIYKGLLFFWSFKIVVWKSFLIFQWSFVLLLNLDRRDEFNSVVDSRLAKFFPDLRTETDSGFENWNPFRISKWNPIELKS